MKIIIIILTLLVFLVYPASADIWQSDVSIISGLNDLGYTSHPAIFNDSGTWKLISGFDKDVDENEGIFVGWYWNGTDWVIDTNVINGLTYVGIKPKPTLFYDVDTWKMIIGAGVGFFYGYEWNGTYWVSNSSIANGLNGTALGVTAPEVFNDGGTWKIIAGDWSGYYYGYYWNGTSWVSDSSVISGFNNLYYIVKPSVFNDSGTLKVLIGEYKMGGAPYYYRGFYWSGSTWISDSTMISGLGTDYNKKAPEIFYKDDKWHLISGTIDGDFRGYILNQSIVSNLKTEHVTNNHQIRTNTTSPYFTWDYLDPESDVQTNWQIQVGTTQGADNMWDSGVMSGTDTFDIYAGSTIGFDTVYYAQVRTNDGITWSAWETGTFMTILNIVSGTVTNSSGALVGVNVTVVGVGSNTTNVTGYYLIPDVPADTHTITATVVNQEDYSNSIAVSEDTIKDIEMSSYTTITLDEYTIKVLTAQNTALQIMDASFGDVYAGNTETLNQSFNLTNIGNIEAAVSATFSSYYGGIYGLTNSPYVIGGSNVSMQKDGGTFTALNNLVTDSIMTDTVTNDGIAYDWNIKTTFPAGQNAAGYSGTIEITFSNN